MASWLEKIENIVLEIRTGDGKFYRPLWKEASREIAFNNESFNFINKPGTYVERKERQGYQYPFVFYFQGENHLETASAFDISAQNKNAWEITHPYYGKILVQPVSLKFDNTQGNNTIVTGTLLETTSIQNISGNVSKIDTIKALNIETGTFSIAAFSLIPPGPTTAGNALVFLERINSFLKLCAKTADELQVYGDLLRTASGAANSIINDVERFARDLNAFINFPAQTIQDVQIRVGTLSDSFAYCLTFANNNGEERLKMFETIGAQLIGSTCENAIIGTYNTRADALKSIDSILASYNAYLDLLNEISPDLAANLDLLVNTTTGGLLEIAFNAKQERTIILNSPSNCIVLAHKYFDGDLEMFLNINKVMIDEYLQVEMGREITYFV